MKKGDTVEAEVIRLDFPDRGIATVTTENGEEVRLRIKNALPGQRILCLVTKNGQGRKEARILEVLRRSTLETETPCPHFARCGGCSYQTLSAQAELTLKEQQVRRLLKPVFARYQDAKGPGEVTGQLPCSNTAVNGREPVSGTPVWEEAVDSPRRFGYRNKMEFTWGDTCRDGPLALGLHRRGSMYDIESVTDCNIVDEDYRRILRAALEFFTPGFARGEITYYHRMTGEGLLRHLLVRKAARTGEILIDLVTTTQTAPGMDTNALWQGFSRTLLNLKLEGRIAGILHTVNDARADAVLDGGTTLLYGVDHFYEELLGLRFRITPFSFFQTNSHSAELLYRKVREYVQLAAKAKAGDDRYASGDLPYRKPVVYDLYSGTGTIAQIVADVSGHVVGIELVSEAVEAARANARENGITNCTFFAGDVLALVDDPEIIDVAGRPDLIILDPPRDGIHHSALNKIIAYGAENIIYVSCKPTSLARDLETLLGSGYRAERLCVVNQFPCVRHIEVSVLLTRVNGEAVPRSV